MTSQTAGGSTERFVYGSDARGSVSVLLDESGQAKEAYGYTAHGDRDTQLTKTTVDETQETTSPFEELNPYRWEGKRQDEATQTLDMGARRFSPKLAAFPEQDAFDDALANLSLATDPLTQNRYAFAGGNPVSFVESDGHEPASSYTDRRSANYYYSRRRARVRLLGRYSSPDAYDRNRRPAWRRQVDYSHRAATIRGAHQRVQQRADDGGFVGGLKAGVEGTWDAVTHPKETAEGLAYAVTHPRQTVEAIANSCDGHSWQWCVTHTGTQIVGTKGATAVVRAARNARPGGPAMYRAVSDGELEDIRGHGFRPDPTGRGYQHEKLFTTNPADAARQARGLHRLTGQVSTIVEARLPSASDLILDRMDAMDVYRVPTEHLQSARLTRVHDDASPFPGP